MTVDDVAGELADEEAQLDELAAVLDELDRHQARRWITVAAFGLAGVASSTLLHHWTPPVRWDRSAASGCRSGSGSALCPRRS